MTEFRAIGKQYDVFTVHTLTASGLNRIRTNTTELDYLFENLDAPRAARLKTWFTGAKGDVQVIFGYTLIPGAMPAINVYMPNDSQAETFIGDFAYEDNQTTQFDNQFYTLSIPYNRRVGLAVRGADNETAYFLYEIVKYLMVSIKKLLVSTYNMLQLRIDGSGLKFLTDGDITIYEYGINLDFYREELVQEVDSAELITDIVINQTDTSITLQNFPTDDPSI